MASGVRNPHKPGPPRGAPSRLGCAAQGGPGRAHGRASGGDGCGHRVDGATGTHLGGSCSVTRCRGRDRRLLDHRRCGACDQLVGGESWELKSAGCPIPHDDGGPTEAPAPPPPPGPADLAVSQPIGSSAMIVENHGPGTATGSRCGRPTRAVWRSVSRVWRQRMAPAPLHRRAHSSGPAACRSPASSGASCPARSRRSRSRSRSPAR